MKTIKYAVMAYVFVSAMSSYAMDKPETPKPVNNTTVSSTNKAPITELKWPGHNGSLSPVALTAALNIVSSKGDSKTTQTETGNQTPAAGNSYTDGDYYPCGNVYYANGGFYK
jgi:hypothetical protein